MATTTFNDLITFSRGSNATLVGPNGLVQWAPANLLTNSESFEASAWSKSDATVTANAAAAPDGTLTADKLAETATTAQHFLFQNAGAAGVHTVTIYAKAAERSWLIVTMNSTNTFFNLGNGTVGSTAGGFIASVTAVGGGWYRCVVTTTLPAAGAIVFSTSTANNVTSYAGTAGSGILIWGAQLELGSTATTYNNTSVRNLLGFSEAFDNAGWTKAACSIVTGAQANPVNGLFNAQKLMEDTSTAAHRVAQIASLVASSPTTFSVYYKITDSRKLALHSTPSNTGRQFDASGNQSAGAFNPPAGGATVTPVGNGWYRASITISPSAGNNEFRLWLVRASDDAINYAGDGSSGVFIYGAQLSNSASLDPYVPTPGAAPSSTAYYGPRLDYDPVTLQPKGLLVEEQRTNLLTYSEQFDNAAWLVLSGATKTANTAVSPDGSSNADTITATSINSAVYQTQAASNSTAYTTTIYLKAGTISEVRFGLTNQNESAVAYYTFTLTGAGSSAVSSVTNFTANSASITLVGNGWYRCAVTATSPSTGTTAVGPMIRLSGAGTAFVWGAQLEAGAFATSYIPTIASTVTRSADVATISGSLFSQWYNQPEGTLVAEVQKFTPSATSTYTYELLGSTSSFSMRVRLGADGRMQSVDGGAVQVDTQIQSSVPTTSSKYGVAYAANNYAGSANGGAVGTDTSATVPAITSLALGSAAVSNLYIRSIRYYPVRAADFQLQQLTS